MKCAGYGAYCCYGVPTARLNNARNQNRLTVLSAVTAPGGIPTRRVLCVDQSNARDHDQVLLRRYQESGCQDAFEQLVARHAGWIGALVRRRVKDKHLAEDVTQAVFIILARKARTIRADVVLSAWLFRVARFAARDALKQELRRSKRWLRAAEMRIGEIEDIDGLASNHRAARTSAAPDADLDDAIACLSETDRQVILLRFYEDKTMAEVGIALGIAEDAAKQRVSRALKRLRLLLGRRGVAIASLSVLVAMLHSASGAKAASVVGTTAAHSMSVAAVGRGEASGQSLQVAQGTLRSIASAQCRLWAAMSSAAMAFVIVIGMLSPVMGQAALRPLRRISAAVALLISDAPHLSGIVPAPAPSQPVPLAKVWVGKANQGGWPVLPLDAPKIQLPMRSISGSNQPVAVAQDVKGQYWYHTIEPPLAGSTSLVSRLCGAIDIDVDHELTMLGAKPGLSERDPIEHSLDYFHAATISAAVQAADWQPLDPPGTDGGVVLPFAGTNGGMEQRNDISLQTVVVPEPMGSSILILAISLVISRRRRRDSSTDDLRSRIV